VSDVDFDRHQLVIRRGKGAKDRMGILPERLEPALRAKLAANKAQHDRDLEHGAGYVELPFAFDRKAPRAPRDWRWPRF
jgi:hypothetical protein